MKAIDIIIIVIIAVLIITAVYFAIKRKKKAAAADAAKTIAPIKKEAKRTVRTATKNKIGAVKYYLFRRKYTIKKLKDRGLSVRGLLNRSSRIDELFLF